MRSLRESASGWFSIVLLTLLPSSWAAGQASFLTEPAQGEPRAIALKYLRARGRAMGLTAEDLDEVIVRNAYASKHNGVTHIYLRQLFRGIEVINGDININVAKDGRIMNLGNRFVANLAAAVNAQVPRLSAREAIGRVADHLGLDSPRSMSLRSALGGPAMAVSFTGAQLSRDNIPVRLVYFPIQPEKTSEARLAWSIVVRPFDNRNWWNLFVDAVTGRVLGKFNWIAHHDDNLPGTNLICTDCYQVFALPKESPSDGGRTVELNPADALASPFGWHDEDGAPGAEFDTARGNNVRAQTDRDANNSFPSGFDVRPDGGPNREFLFPLDLSMQPFTYRVSAVTNLFYWNNILHDLFYRYGFDEAAGNFQQNNYGRGGVGGDPVQADAQDGSGTNNANFGTPPDGLDPRMQMFIWTSPDAHVLEVMVPPSLADPYPASGAAFGPPLDLSGVNGVLVLAEGPGAATDGCQPLTNPGEVAGNIALIDRGDCAFVTKVKNAQLAGATTVVIVNNGPGNPTTLSGTDPTITIPSGMISLANGNLIKGELPGVTANFRNAGTTNRDSDLDNGIIIHEYGHGVSNRLTGGPSRAGCLQNQEQAGEGWSDFFTLVFNAQAADTGAMPRGIGTYAIFEPPSGPGIRNFPYSTDLAVNPQTYADIGSTNIPHGVGEIWASMLWEMYWALVQRDGFDADLYQGTGGNNVALQLVMDGLKFQRCSPSFVHARNGILFADAVNNSGANECLIWKAFAKRGLGVSANAGSAFAVGDETQAFDIPAACIEPPTLSIAGSCPGPVTVAIDGAMPNSFLALVAGASEGSTTLASGKCAGTVLGLESPSFVAWLPADGTGAVSVPGNPGPAACGMLLQALDATTCLPTNVAPLTP